MSGRFLVIHRSRFGIILNIVYNINIKKIRLAQHESID